MEKYISYINPRENIRGFIIAILILAGLGFTVGAAVVTTNKPEQKNIEEEIADKRFSSPFHFIYAFWAGDKSEVRSLDLSSGEEFSLATLPLNVKHVKLLSPKQLIYISETDDNDYGSYIVVKNISDGTEKIVVTASDDVRIDDYRVSPNGQFLATWEVSLPQGSDKLYGGISRVYGIDLNTNVKSQIYSEVANAPVHYPVAVTNDGQIYMDKFLPNDSAGWAYGMSMSNINGSAKSDLTAMQNGTYASQPVLSPDGDKLVFTGYDGSKGSGVEIVRDVRRAVLSANTVDVLDLSTLSRRRLSSLPTDNLYTSASWDSVSGNVLFSMVSKNLSETGTYSYNLGANLFEKIKLAPNELNPQNVIGVLSPGVVLTGSVSVSDGTLGNLGSDYEQVLEGAFIYDEGNNDKIGLNIVGGFIQPLGLKPASYFASSFTTFEQSASESGGIKNKQEDQLQLQTFTIKPTLGPQRTNQQSGERCRDVSASRCNEILGTNYTPDQALQARRSSAESTDEAFSACVQEQWASARQAGLCSDSPLYLYGEKNKEVNIKVGTSVFDSNAHYNPLTGYTGKLTGDGGLVVGNDKFFSLEFGYEPAAKVVKPVRGYIIKRKDLDQKLDEYADKLGMNSREKEDFKAYIKSHTSSQEIFLSHFSNEVSKKILPLYFSPQPDSYTNIVFYISEDGPFGKVEPPEIKKIERVGFSAVEISYIKED